MNECNPLVEMNLANGEMWPLRLRKQDMPSRCTAAHAVGPFPGGAV
jgi:hypothetical protein